MTADTPPADSAAPDALGDTVIIRLRRAYDETGYALLRNALEEIVASAAREAKLRSVLERAQTILANMAKENKPEIAFRWQRWPLSHEPLRADAKNLLPEIDAALAGGSDGN